MAWALGVYGKAYVYRLFAITCRWERPQLNTVHHLTAEHALHLQRTALPSIRPPQSLRAARHARKTAALLECRSVAA